VTEGKLWAACSVGEILREDPEDGHVWWEKDPDSEVYVYAGRYRLKAGAERRLHFILAESCPGFHLGRRRNAILRSKLGPVIARDPLGYRNGYATRSSGSSGVADFRIRYYVEEVPATKAYDVRPTFVTCAYCNGTGERVEWPATVPARCKYCEGTTKLLSSLRDKGEIRKHEQRIAYTRDMGYPPHTPVQEEDFRHHPV
jgi:hypothetical protein